MPYGPGTMSMAGTLTLTFDNGPTPGVTDAVLDLLADRGVKSTFFVIGENLRFTSRLDLARRAVAEGHWIGNHTLTHTVPLGESTAAGQSEHEIRAAQQLIGPLAHADKLFRPFAAGGLIGPHLLDEEAVDCLVREAFTCVMWTVVPRDWDNPEWVETTLDALDHDAWPVVVLHDLPDCCLARLPELLDELEARAVAVSQAFPDSVLPIWRGMPSMNLEPIVQSVETTQSRRAR
jgi:peptidoglycan-N-acetylglucosamine deacetylase